jgi:hypothetical protein
VITTDPARSDDRRALLLRREVVVPPAHDTAAFHRLVAVLAVSIALFAGALDAALWRVARRQTPAMFGAAHPTAPAAWRPDHRSERCPAFAPDESRDGGLAEPRDAGELSAGSL